MNFGISNSGSGNITSHRDMVAGVGNVVGARADLLRTVDILRELVDQSTELSTTDRHLSRGAIEEIDAELRKETPERSRLAEALTRLTTSAKSITKVVTEATRLSDAIHGMLT